MSYFFGRGTARLIQEGWLASTHYVESWIYFVRCGKHIKIGVTTNLPQRIAELRVSNPLPITVIYIEAGTSEREAEFHKQWKHCHCRGEWFHETPELRAWLRSQRNVVAQRRIRKLLGKGKR